MAVKYVQETSQREYQDFLGWIGRIDSEKLRYEFGLRSPVLEDITKALFRSGTNPYLEKYSNTVELMPYETWVKGISYENRRIVAIGAKVGDSVELERDYNNAVDRNAVKVLLNGQTLGYIERSLAQLMAVDLDCGMVIKGKVVEVEKSEIPQIKIKMTLGSETEEKIDAGGRS